MIVAKSVLKFKIPDGHEIEIECALLESEIESLAEEFDSLGFSREIAGLLSGNSALLKFTPNNSNNRMSQYFDEEVIYSNSSIADGDSVFCKSVVGHDIDIAILPDNVEATYLKTFRTGSNREINAGSPFERYHDTEFKLLECLVCKIENQKNLTVLNLKFVAILYYIHKKFRV